MNVLRRAWAVLALVLATLLLPVGSSAAGLGAAALRARYTELAPQLASNPFGGPLVLLSDETNRRLEGNVFAVLDHPFQAVSSALSDPDQWCDILILHLNTKYCRRSVVDGATVIDMRVGRKVEQEVQSASLLRFAWREPVVKPDYLQAEMNAPDGPYDTHEYRLLAEAIPLEGGRSFLHLSYSFTYGASSSFALQLYLNTFGRDKVGFSRVDKGGGEPQYVGGMRGVAERNVMRYYLAVEAYLGSLSAPPAERLQRRLEAWFDATEKYPRQLHEVERPDYLRMKHNEVQRQQAAAR